MNAALYDRVRQILASARAGVARSVNTAQVVANWLTGREIIEEEQKGHAKAGYGKRLLQELSARLKAEFGSGYSVDNLELFRRFFLDYPQLLADASPTKSLAADISDAVRRKSSDLAAELVPFVPKTWQAGRLHPNLSWTHYRTLLRVERPEARAFYEIEALHNHWAARELERQINSVLYERLAQSKDQAGVLRLATKGHQ